MRLLKGTMGINILLLTAFLNGCGNNNPLLHQDNIDGIKSFTTFSSDDVAMVCPNYWAGEPSKDMTAVHKKKCDQELVEMFNIMKKNRQDILQGATLEQFRDPLVWKMYLGEIYRK